MTRLARTPAILGIVAGGMLAAGLPTGCSSNQSGHAPALDAAAGHGGATAAPGSGGSAAGGVVRTGGIMAPGGSTTTGGVVGGGGTTGLGGAGGATGTGGTTRAGGATGAGGTTRAGGATGAGGTTASGGASGMTGSGGTTGSGGAIGAGGATQTGGTTASPPVDAGASSCNNPLPLQCGDRLNHSTLIQGRANVWYGYNCTQRYESGREAIYAFQTTAACQVALQLKNLTVDLDLFVLTGCVPGPYDKCSSTPLDLQTIEKVNFTSQAGQPYFVVVDGYDDAAGTYTLQVDCTCNPDAGTSDASRTDAWGDSAVAPGCDLDVAAKAIAASGVNAVGSPQTLNVTLPTTMATDDNWGLKETICQQGGYDIAPLAGKTVCLVEQGSTQLCQGAPSDVWVVMNDGAVACIYKAVRQGVMLAPGVYSVTDPNCSQDAGTSDNAAGCPQNPPGVGLSCSNEGTTCVYDGCPTGAYAKATCTAGAWTINIGYCPNDVCPSGNCSTSTGG